MLARILFLLIASVVGFNAAAQYPSRPIHLIVPIPPGGAPDIAARVLGQKLSEQMGQPVVVENRVGSNGNIATELVARAAPDGYTLGLVADSQIAINPHLYSKMSFDTLRDLTPVSSVASNQFVLAINPSLPVGSFPEFIEYARKANPPLSYASGGNGSQHQLTMELLKARDPMMKPDIEKVRLDIALGLTNTEHVKKNGLSSVTPEKLKRTIDQITGAYGLPHVDPATVYTDRFLPPQAERMPPKAGN